MKRFLSMYGMTAELAAGEHTFKLYSHPTKPIYAMGFAYTLAEEREVIAETEAPETDAPETVLPATETDAETPAAASEGIAPEIWILIGVWAIAAAAVIVAVCKKKK